MSKKQQEALPSASIEIKEKDFAAMNGAKTYKINDSIQPEENPAPEEIVTARTVSQSPLLKMGVVALICSLFVIIIGALIGNSMNMLKFESDKVQPPTEAQTPIAEPENETGKDKTALALTSQNYELKKIRDQKPSTVSTPTPTPSPAPIAPVTPTNRPVQRVQQPYSVTSQPPPPRTRTFPTARGSQPQLQPKIAQPVRQSPQPRPQANIAHVDPTQQWLIAANAGSFSSSGDEPEGEEQKVTGIEGGTGGATQVAEVNKTTGDYNTKRVLVGSTAEGTLETPIAWGAGDTGNQNYLVKVSKPLKASDGSDVLPVGAYLVVQLSESNGSGFAKLRGVSVLVNSNGDTQEKSLPPNAVLIMSKDGSFLKAESRKGSNLGNNFISAIVAGVAKAAEVQNRPITQVSTSSNGFSSLSTTNEQKDLSAAFGEGAFNSVLDNIKSSNVARSQQLSGREEVFVIDVGKPVQIFVNQTISL